MTLLKLFIMCLPFGAGLVNAGEPIAPAVRESTISVAAFKGLYLQTGIGNDLPQVLVYRTDGRCAGVLDHNAEGRLEAAISEVLASSDSECRPFLSNEFGATQASTETGPGKITIQLLAFSEAFCTACVRMSKQVRRIAQAESNGYDWVITWVSLGTDANPRRAPDSDCAECPKD